MLCVPKIPRVVLLPYQCAPTTPTPFFIARFHLGSGFSGVSVLYSITFSCVRNEYMSFLVYGCGHRVIVLAALRRIDGSVYFLTAVHMAE